MQKRLLFLVMASFAISASAETPVSFLPTRLETRNLPEAQIVQAIKRHFTVENYRAVKVQPMYTRYGEPSHLIVYLLANGFHRVDFARVQVDKDYRFLSVERDYSLTEDDIAQQPGLDPSQAVCPDESIEFIDFAPNDDQTEQEVTKEVAVAAKAHGLKTKDLLRADATRQNYLNWMACPKLRGNFYDGDANPQVITTVDGTVSYQDFKDNLTGAWKYNVTNVWLACEAYNDPMLSTVQKDVQAKKYAAGINDLSIGPSDRAGACAMKAFIAGKPMTSSFQSCYNQFDTSSDHWGFGGDGSDLF